MNIINLDIKSLNMDGVVRELQKIPLWLGVLLIVVCIMGACYWLFSRSDTNNTTNELNYINQEIIQINEFINKTVDVSDYKKDFDDINYRLDVLEEMIMYESEMREVEMDYIINVIDMHHDINGVAFIKEYKLMVQHYKQMMNKYHERYNKSKNESHVNSNDRD